MSILKVTDKVTRACTQTPDFSGTPDELLEHMVSFLDFPDMRALSISCKDGKKIVAMNASSSFNITKCALLSINTGSARVLIEGALTRRQITLIWKAAKDEIIKHDNVSHFFFFRAVTYNFVDIARELMPKVNVNEDIDMFYTQAPPLYLAASRRAEPLVQLLLTEGAANPNLESEYYCPPLVEATKHASLGSVRLLLEKQANPNVRDEKGNTPLMNAACARNHHIVKLLLAHDANPNLLNNNGASALAYAIYNRDPYMVHLLIESGKLSDLELDKGRMLAEMDLMPKVIRVFNRFNIHVGEERAGALQEEVNTLWETLNAESTEEAGF